MRKAVVVERLIVAGWFVLGAATIVIAQHPGGVGGWVAGAIGIGFLTFHRLFRKYVRPQIDVADGEPGERRRLPR